MALLSCPECTHTVSDKALACPGCGYPLSVPSKSSQTPAYKRLPNGYGSIKRLSGTRSNPYAAYPPLQMCCEDTTHKVKRPAIGYFPDWNSAYRALAEFHSSPYDIRSRMLSFADVYQQFYNDKFTLNKKSLSLSSKYAYETAFKHCTSIHHLPFFNLRKSDMQRILDECTLGYSTLCNLKKLFCQLYKYAMENDIVQKNYAQFVTINREDDNEKGEPFSPEELALLWKNHADKTVQMILILIYTGFRIVAFETMEINLEQGYLKGGVKTASSKGRIVPIHPAIYQSSKYTQTTATSNKVVFTVGEAEFEVTQDTVKKFTVKFDSKVASVGEVTVNRLYKGFEIPVLVKEAKLADDGMSASVELYTDLKNNEEYAITVAGYETYTLTASAGDPVEVLIYVDEKAAKDAAELVYIDGNPVALKYKLIDAKGVDVTAVAGGVVLFNAKDYSTDGSYYVSADQMWFAKEGVEIVVTADYQSGRYENGVQLAPAKGEKVFYSMKKEPVQVVGMADWKIAGTKADWSDAKKTVPFGEAASLEVKVKLTEGDPVVAAANGAVLDGYITFQELNPEIAALSGSSIVYFKQGTAKVLVYYNYTDANGALVELPIAQVNAEATAPKALQSMALDKTMVTLGTVDGYDEATITVSAKNNYSEDYSVTGKVTIEGVDDNAKAALQADAYTIVDNKITLKGYELQQNTPNKPATVQFLQG